MNQLPAHLQNLPASGLAARAAEGIGSARPPHLLTANGAFVMVDAAGNEQRAQTTFLDVCVADISDVMCKQYYGDENGPKKWDPNSTDPPACWSANGIAPSVEAISPQSPRCDSCEWNKRGSAVAMDGKTPTKACRDEKWLAILIAGVPMPLQMKLTPGSFTNWRAYVEIFKGKPIDMCHVFTRLGFEAGANGVLTFALSPVGYIDPNVAAMYVQMRNGKASDVLVGRTDRPRLTAGTPANTGQEIATMRTLPTDSTPAQVAEATQPAGEQQPARRRRRTVEQIAADNAAAAGGAPQTQPAGVAPGMAGGAFGNPSTTTPAAPFAQPSPAGGGQAAPFGIAQNPPPPPAGLDASLDALFNTGT